jgi:hypothetical protein
MNNFVLAKNSGPGASTVTSLRPLDPFAHNFVSTFSQLWRTFFALLLYKIFNPKYKIWVDIQKIWTISPTK